MKSLCPMPLKGQVRWGKNWETKQDRESTHVQSSWHTEKGYIQKENSRPGPQHSGSLDGGETWMVATQSARIFTQGFRVSSQLGPTRTLECFQSAQHSFAWGTESVKVSSKRRKTEEKRTEGLSTLSYRPTQLSFLLPYNTVLSLPRPQLVKRHKP